MISLGFGVGFSALRLPAQASAVAVASWNNTLGTVDASYSDNDRTITRDNANGGYRFTRSIETLVGKAYWEIVIGNSIDRPGFATNVVGDTTGGTAGTNAFYWSASSHYDANGLTSIGMSMAAGDRLQYAVDTPSNLFWVTKNGLTWNGNASADPAAGVAGLPIPAGLTLYAMMGVSNNAGTYGTLHGSADRFAYTPPSGFAALKV